MTGSASPSDAAGALGGALGRRRRHWLAALAGLLVAIGASVALGEPIRCAVYDSWQKVAPRDLTGIGIEVVEIDPESLAKVGTWPWPRPYIAELIDALGDRGAKVIGLDMIFSEPDRLDAANFLRLHPALSAAARRELGGLPTMDSILAEAAGRNPVVLGRVGLHMGGTGPDELFLTPQIAGTPPPRLLRFPEILANISIVDDSAMSHGLLNGPPDGDGRVRRVPLVAQVGKRLMPGLAFELARNAVGEDRVTVTPGGIRLGKRELPVSETGQMAFRLGRYPPQHIHSAIDVLQGRVPARAFAGRIVLVGLAAEGIADVVATPVAAESYGVYMQAQAVDAMLRGGWIARPAWLGWGEWLLGLLLAAGFASGLQLTRPVVIGVALAMAALPLSSFALFIGPGIFFDPARPFMLAAGAFAGAAVSLFVAARRDRAALARTLVEQRVAAAAQEGELEAARRIQLGMLPDRSRLARLDPRLKVASLLEPARQVGGDFYDVIRLDADRIVFLVGDVTGKGVPAALYMALSKALAKSVLAHGDGRLDAAVQRLNRDLLREDNADIGLTVLMVLVDCRSGALEMVNAGHDNPIVLATGGDAPPQVHRLDGGPPLCLFDFDYPLETGQLLPGQTLVLLTDGVTEAASSDGAYFGQDRTMAALAGTEDAAAALAGLERAVRAFQADAEPNDDLTILAVTYVGEPA